MIYILMAVGTLFLLTGCKKTVGTPEDNAVTDESDDKKEDTDQEKKRSSVFCGIDMSNPFYATLKRIQFSRHLERNREISCS